MAPSTSVLLKWPDKSKDLYEVSIGNLPVDFVSEKAIQTTKIGKLSKEDILKAIGMGTAVPAPDPFIPGIRYISSSQNVVVLERPPTYKMISFTPVVKDEAKYDQIDKYLFRVPIPWQVYLIALDHSFNIINLFMFFRTAPLASLNDQLYYPYFPNFYTDSRVCKASLNSIQHYEPTLQGACSAAYNMIWSSGFNLDVHKTLDYYSTNKYWSLLFKTNYATNMNAYSAFYNHLEKMTPQSMCQKPGYPVFNRNLREAMNPDVLAHEAPVTRRQSSVITFASALYDAIEQKK